MDLIYLTDYSLTADKTFGFFCFIIRKIIIEIGTMRAILTIAIAMLTRPTKINKKDAARAAPTDIKRKLSQAESAGAKASEAEL